MKLLDINPFVRTALTIKILPFFKNTISFDCRLFYTIDGSGTCYLNDKPYEFEKGTLMLWQNGVKYRMESSSNLTFIVINFDYTTNNRNQTTSIKTVIDDGKAYLNDKIFFEDAVELNEPIVLRNVNYLSDIITYLNLTLNEKQNQSEFLYEKRSAYFKSCILNVIESVRSQNTGVNSKRFEIVLDYVKNHYQENLTNEYLASLVGYHPYYLNRLFNERYGVTLHQYLINYRLLAVENLLISTDAPIADIACETGFSSSISLTVNFKNKHKITPSAFRKQYRNFT